MPNPQPVQDRFDQILDQAMKQPGVAELIAVYEAAEAAYTGATQSSTPVELTVSSTNASTQTPRRD